MLWFSFEFKKIILLHSLCSLVVNILWGFSTFVPAIKQKSFLDIYNLRNSISVLWKSDDFTFSFLTKCSNSNTPKAVFSSSPSNIFLIINSYLIFNHRQISAADTGNVYSIIKKFTTECTLINKGSQNKINSFGNRGRVSNFSTYML